VPKSCRLSTIPLFKNENYQIQVKPSESKKQFGKSGTNTMNLSGNILSLPFTRCTSNISHQNSSYNQFPSFHQQNFVIQKQTQSSQSLHSFQSQIAQITGTKNLFKCGQKQKANCSLNESDLPKAVKSESNTRKHSLGHVPNSALANYNMKAKRQTMGTQKSSRNSSSSMSIAGKQSKIEELRNKYKSEHTIYEKHQGRNNVAFAKPSLKTQHYEISNSISESSLEIAKDQQFQTIQEKPAIVIEEDNEGDKSQNLEEFLGLQEDCVQEDSVVIRKPISSKKSKSLENISKAKGKERNLLELYKKQFQLQEHSEKAKDGTQIKIATIDISYAKLFQDKQNSSRLSTNRDPKQVSQQRVCPNTNFIKKNIKFVASLNSQVHTMEASTVSLAQAKSNQALLENQKIKDQRAKRASRGSISIFQGYQNPLSLRRLSKAAPSKEAQKKVIISNKSHVALVNKACSKVLMNPDTSVEPKPRVLNQSASQQTLKEIKHPQTARMFSFDTKHFFSAIQGKGSPVMKQPLGSTQNIRINIVNDSMEEQYLKCNQTLDQQKCLRRISEQSVSAEL
jgi:hypothetical protein